MLRESISSYRLFRIAVHKELPDEPSVKVYRDGKILTKLAFEMSCQDVFRIKCNYLSGDLISSD
jgi:hypothetical protein